MNKMNGLPRILACAITASALVTVFPAGGRAASTKSDVQVRQLELFAGMGELITLPRAAAKVFIADPEVADIQIGSDRSVFVVARKPGATVLVAVGSDNEEFFRAEIHVTHNTRAAEEQIHALYPQYHITVRSSPGRIILSGAVATAADATAIVNIIKGQLVDKDEIVNQLSITSSNQVNLKVRIAEISRSVDNEFGINWQSLFKAGTVTFGLYNGRSFTTTDTLGNTSFKMAASGAGSYTTNFASSNGRVNLTTVIDALDSEGLAHVLAEPNLSAVSGQSASFLAGGEVPVPSEQNNTGSSNTLTVVYKNVGVQLQFTPTVISPERISLKVKPEVSEINSAYGVTVGDYTIPGFTTRSVETTVELGSGQSFAIAGLMSHTTKDSLSKLPGLGNLPVLGPLFRSTSFTNNESELVIVVTPFLVKPTTPANVPSPLDDLRPATELEKIINFHLTQEGGHNGGGGLLENGTRLRGDAGFIY